MIQLVDLVAQYHSIKKEIDATIYGAPELRMYADTSMAAHEVGPQFAFQFRAGWSPEIVLRDVHGRVVWRAP